MVSTPSYALSIRIQHVRSGAYRGRRRHDLREGPQPAYVDTDRTDYNSIIIAAPGLSVIRSKCEARRKQRNLQRRMKSDAAIATAGIITWGRGLQPHVEALSASDQDQLYKAVSEAVAEVCGSTVEGLAVHRDEAAPHGHLWMPAIAMDGRPVSKYLSRGDMSRLQDAAMEAAKPWLAMIQPPERKATRIARGDDASMIYHRSVAQLHADLPSEIESVQAVLDELREKVVLDQARVKEMQARVTQLEVRESRTDKEEKRLGIYRRRLESRTKELDDREERIEAIIQESALAATEAVAAVIDGRIKPGEREKTLNVAVELRPALRPIWKSIAPTLQRLSSWWEAWRPKVEALSDLDRGELLDRSLLDEPQEVTFDYPDLRPPGA